MLELVSLLVLTGVGWVLVRMVHRAWTPDPRAVTVLPLASGRVPEQHALSRHHARWYTTSVVFLAFDVEMLFMYPWAVVVADLGMGAVIEMFGFLAVLIAAVVWARREGAFRWA